MDLQSLQKHLGLINPPTDPYINDVVFIAVDFEYTDNFSPGNRRCQAGVAILDTRDLVSPFQTPSISTFNFEIGSTSYHNRCNNEFLFGKTVKIQKEDICHNLEALISRQRNNVLVGHAIQNELKILKILNFDLDLSIIGILDTQRLALQTRSDSPGRLRDLLRDLQCPYRHLHNAGNDAHFTLRALLLLAVRSYSDINIVDNNAIRQRLVLLREIAQSSLPPDSNRIAEENRKKQERLQAKEQMRVAERERILQAHVAAMEQKRAERKLKRESDMESSDLEEGIMSYARTGDCNSVMMLIDVD